MDVIEILENPSIAVRVCGTYKGLLIVVKLFDTKSDRSIKFYEYPERLESVKSFWSTKNPIKQDSPNYQHYCTLAQTYVKEIVDRLQSNSFPAYAGGKDHLSH
jgi:hypothetical protein